jgi:hypothetical protein
LSSPWLAVLTNLPFDVFQKIQSEVIWTVYCSTSVVTFDYTTIRMTISAGFNKVI